MMRHGADLVMGDEIAVAQTSKNARGIVQNTTRPIKSIVRDLVEFGMGLASSQ